MKLVFLTLVISVSNISYGVQNDTIAKRIYNILDNGFAYKKIRVNTKIDEDLVINHAFWNNSTNGNITTEIMQKNNINGVLEVTTIVYNQQGSINYLVSFKQTRYLSGKIDNNNYCQLEKEAKQNSLYVYSCKFDEGSGVELW